MFSDLQWYDYPWLLLVVGQWLFVVLLCVTCGLLLFRWAQGNGFARRYLVASGIFSLALIGVLVCLGQGEIRLQDFLLVYLGFAVPLHIASATVMVFSASPRRERSGRFTMAQAALFAFVLVIAMMPEPDQAEPLPLAQDVPVPEQSWNVPPGQTTMVLRWPYDQAPVPGRRYVLRCSDGTTRAGMTDNDGVIDVSTCSPQMAIQVSLPPEI